MQIPAGYRLPIVAPNGDVAGEVDLGGYDLEKPMGRQSVIEEVHEITDRDILIGNA